nr:MAG TPA: hypothetical protein [Caudoviricetes sp.]
MGKHPCKPLNRQIIGFYSLFLQENGVLRHKNYVIFNFMSKKSPKPKVIPVITGIHKQGERKVIALHHHPKAITQALDALVEEAKDNPPLKGLFEDIRVLTHWALARLPMVEPPKEKPSTSEESEVKGN